MLEKPAEYPELTPALRDGSIRGLLKFFGPGAIVACVTIGSGETVFASRGGAIFGYTMLWCFVAGALCKGVQVYSASRMMTLTGLHPLQSWMDMPGPRGWFVWFVSIMTILWMPFWLAGLPVMLGDFTNWIVFPDWVVDTTNTDVIDTSIMSDVDRYKLWTRSWGTLYIVVALLITWMQSYGLLEKVQTAIVGLLLFCMLLAAIVSRPDWLGVVDGMIPRKPQYDDWVKNIPDMKERNPWIEVMVYLGVIGGGAQDYLGYLGILREKAWGMLGYQGVADGIAPRTVSDDAANLARGRRWLRAPQIDMGISTLAILLFTVCFVLLGATTLYPKHQAPTGFHLLTEQSVFLVNLAGENATLRWVVGWTYKTGIFFAFFGTILGAYEIYTRTIRESAIALFPHMQAVSLRTFRLVTMAWSGGGGLILLWSLKKSPVWLVTPAALVGSGLICGLWCFAMLWSDRVHVPAALRMPLLLKIALVVAGIILTVGPLIGLWVFFVDLQSSPGGH